MPKVETAFGCNGKRAIAGLSMGGFGTVYHALKYPGKYTCAYAMSPAVSEDLNALVDVGYVTKYGTGRGTRYSKK